MCRKLASAISAVVLHSATAVDQWGCSGRALIPPDYQGSGWFYNETCETEGLECRFALGNWTVTQSAVIKYGNAGRFSSGTDTMMPSGFVFTLCPTSFYVRSDSSITTEFISPDQPDVKACATLTRLDPANPGNPGIIIDFNFQFDGIRCNDTWEYERIVMPGFSWGSPSVSGCPVRNVLPPWFVFPPVQQWPSDALDPNIGWYGGLVPQGSAETFGFGLLNITTCAISLTVMSHDPASNISTWQITYGDARTGRLNGCVTYIRSGRHVAFASRFLGNHDMDGSCGYNYANGSNLCCWNWTIDFDDHNDGFSTKILWNYLPLTYNSQPWSPYGPSPPQSGAVSIRLASLTGGLLQLLPSVLTMGVVAILSLVLLAGPRIEGTAHQ